MVNLPAEFIVNKFIQYAGYARYKKLSNVYEGGCPICREGNSWGQKRRLFYLAKKNIICCHNCGWYSNPYKWIKKVTGTSDIELLSEIRSFDTSTTITFKEEVKKEIKTETLPENSINLFDSNQVEYYKNNDIVSVALNYIKERRLDNCINKPPALYISLTDKVHKNRLIIPFYYQGKIIFYQTRTLLAKDSKTKPKYLSKIGGEKSLFNIDNIDNEYEYIFLFEGPIDSCFLKNGVGITGIQEKSKQTLNNLQQKQVGRFPLHKKIYVFDSQWLDNASLKKSGVLLKNNENVFIWPERLGKQYKDFNDVCIKLQRDMIRPKFIIDNTFTGIKGLVELSKVSKYRN